MKMSVNPTGKATKPDVEKAMAAIVNDDKYRYSLYVNRRLMADYINLCKKRRVKANEQIAAFLERELKRYDVMT